MSAQRDPAAAMGGPLALPRRNGELMFEHPWQSRVFGTTLALHEAGMFEWPQFQQRLAARIGARPEPAEAYYERWLEALESLLVEASALSAAEVGVRVAAYESGGRDAVDDSVREDSRPANSGEVAD